MDLSPLNTISLTIQTLKKTQRTVPVLFVPWIQHNYHTWVLPLMPRQKSLLNTYCVPALRAKVPLLPDSLSSWSPNGGAKDGGKGLKVTPCLQIQLVFNSKQRCEAYRESSVLHITGEYSPNLEMTFSPEEADKRRMINPLIIFSLVASESILPPSGPPDRGENFLS